MFAAVCVLMVACDQQYKGNPKMPPNPKAKKEQKKIDDGLDKNLKNWVEVLEEAEFKAEYGDTRENLNRQRAQERAKEKAEKEKTEKEKGLLKDKMNNLPKTPVTPSTGKRC